MPIKINIPSSLNEITLRQYKQFLDIQKENKEDRFLNAKMIQVFCKVNLEQVMRLKLSDSESIVKIISDMFEEKPALVKKFKIGKTEYGFHPELDAMTLGEYIDLDTFISDWDNMEKAMNVLYRPVLVSVKERYSIEDYNIDTASDMLDMPMDAVMSAVFFLWNLGIELSTAMTNSLDNQETELLTQYLNSQKNGVGINQFLDSLKGTLDDLKISLN
jgi:hypothetical protein|tara:strand:+ start:255 stop:905 length:651 start_codon:yes stop_codon:yes gene_type:complete